MTYPFHEIKVRVAPKRANKLAHFDVYSVVKRNYGERTVRMSKKIYWITVCALLPNSIMAVTVDVFMYALFF